VLDSPRVRLQRRVWARTGRRSQKIGSMRWGFAEDFKIENVEAKFSATELDLFGIGNSRMNNFLPESN